MTPETHTIRCNGLTMRVTEAGCRGQPLVLLAHGWPELAYSWRHQVTALAQAGFHVLAPDMRGFGGTEAPPGREDYDILHLVDDMAGLVRHVGAEHAVIAGHDWGAVVAWHAALLRPDLFRAVAALSVPYFGPPPAAPTDIWKKRYGDEFFYILYHQEPGVAEAEYDDNPEGLLRMLYASPDSPRDKPSITSSRRAAGGFIGRWGRPLELPGWLSREDLQVYVDAFRQSGFRGGINWYRNFDRNWRLLKDRDPVIKVPALYVVGSADLVIAGMTRDDVVQRMAPVVPQLRHVEWIEGAGHWVQQERPGVCNRALIEFLDGLHS